MKPKRILQLLLPTLTLWSAPPAATAEPINITAGAISVGPGLVGGPLTLRGTDGVRPFSFDGRIDAAESRVDPYFSCHPCSRLATELSVAVVSASAIFGDVIYGDDMYRVGSGFRDSEGTLFLQIAGSGAQPSPPASVGVTTTLMVPFTASGFLFPPVDLGLGLRYPFLGSGVVTVTLFGDPGDGVNPTWAFQSAEYRFGEQGEQAPIPEPASLLLLTTGLAGVVLRRRYRGH